MSLSDACKGILLSATQQSGICYRWAQDKPSCYCTNLDTNSILNTCVSDDKAQWFPQFEGYLKIKVDSCQALSLPTDGILTGLSSGPADICKGSILSAEQQSGICYKWALNKTECECTKVDTNAILSSCAKTDVSQWRTQFDGYLKSRLDACKSASLPTDFILTELPKSSSEVCRNSLLSAAQESGICTKWATDKNSCYCGHIDTNVILTSCGNEDKSQ
ncbi:hypothetical protein HDU99_003879, partial [Rhizoclosmatium hyalinum]